MLHLYADDTQLYLSCKPQDINSAMGQLEDCISSLYGWMCKHHLKLNCDKTEFLVLASKTIRNQLELPTLHIGNQLVTPSSSAKNIGVIMDSHASMEAHISSVCRASYLHIRNIGRLKQYLDQDSLETIVHAFISSRLDYCNSLLHGVPSIHLHRLQKIQNQAARILTGLTRRDHITPALFSLHWLPVSQRIIFKVLTLVHKTVYGSSPSYLKDIIKSHVY